MSDSPDLQALTARVVAAYISRNPVSPGDLPALIMATAAALQGLGKSAPAAHHPVRLTPAVPIRRSVMADAVICLECGRRGKTIRKHLNVAHGLTPAEYKARWGLPHDYHLTSPQYAAARSEAAKRIGLGKNRRKVAEVEVEAAPPAPVRKARARKAG